MTPPAEHANTRLDRIEEAVRTMAWWLVAAQTGFGQIDAQGIERILDGKDEGPTTPRDRGGRDKDDLCA